MASWFTTRAAGFVVTPTEWNDALAAMADWLGDVNAGTHNLSNLGTLTFGAAGGVADGSAGAPGLRFAGDPDTGVARLAANQIDLVCGGVSKAQVGANGFSVLDDLFIGNSGGDVFNTFRIDGFANALYIVGKSALGAATGTSVIIRTAAAGGGDTLDRVVFGPSGTIATPFLPSSNPGAGTKQLWYDPADGNRVKYAA